ncbi:hypothetical protein [Streptomyces sp. D2-8]|uniref:hypothetical protein n=1 Tax=Streptomyces sp. D2-8 TaxID=2707767 RepID=UPI0020BE75BB|nr:hypothetical protein [Streptomyces sp. D2-8]
MGPADPHRRHRPRPSTRTTSPPSPSAPSSTTATRAPPTASPAPETVTHTGQVTAIGHTLGRDLRFTELSPDEAGPELFPHVPPGMLTALLKSFAATVGTTPEITDTVREITGRPAPFAARAEDHTADSRNRGRRHRGSDRFSRTEVPPPGLGRWALRARRPTPRRSAP